MSLEKVWYVHCNNQTYGPYTGDEIISMLKDGSVQFNDYIFKDGFPDWEYIYNVSQFDRRLINPGGSQPVVEAPKAVAPPIIHQEQQQELSKLWFVHDGQNQMGPYEDSYIKQSLDNKTVFWTYYVWREGMDDWIQIKDCKEFDRRKIPRNLPPQNLNITTKMDEIKTQAAQIIKTAPVQSSCSTSHTECEIENLKGRYPVKAIVFLSLFTLILFGGIYSYPWLLEQIRQHNAMKMFEKAITLIESEELEQGYDTLFQVFDIYPATRAEKKSQNYLLSKEIHIRKQLADSGRRVKKLMDLFTQKYGILPANAVDINYVPSFWLEYFGEIYYKRDKKNTVSVIAHGIRMPVEDYVFSQEGTGEENEAEINRTDFESKRQNYIKFVYKGNKTQITPLKPIMSRSAKKETARPRPVPKRVEPKKEVPVPVKPVEEKKLEPEDQEEQVEEEVIEPEEEEEEVEVEVEEADEPAAEEAEPAPTGDEYGDLIDKIKKDK